MKKDSLIRKIYLYLFAIIGLVLMVISGVRLIDMGLKAWVFTKADEQEKIYSRMPAQIYPVDKMEGLSADGSAQLTEQEREQIRIWLADYKEWKQREDNLDPVRSRRERDASNAIAMILIGLPLYLFHWGIIRRETKE